MSDQINILIDHSGSREPVQQLKHVVVYPHGEGEVDGPCAKIHKLSKKLERARAVHLRQQHLRDGGVGWIVVNERDRSAVLAPRLNEWTNVSGYS